MKTLSHTTLSLALSALLTVVMLGGIDSLAQAPQQPLQMALKQQPMTPSATPAKGV